MVSNDFVFGHWPRAQKNSCSPRLLCIAWPGGLSIRVIVLFLTHVIVQISILNTWKVSGIVVRVNIGRAYKLTDVHVMLYILFFFFILLLLVYLNRRFTLWMCEKFMVFLLLQIFMKGKRMFELFMNVNVDISFFFFSYRNWYLISWPPFNMWVNLFFLFVMQNMFIYCIQKCSIFDE